jgi:uncharacterized protein
VEAPDSEVLSAPYVLEFTYTRSVGSVIGQFLTGLRDKKILGARTEAGKVIVPATEYDPETGEAIKDLVEVAPRGTVQTWSWVVEPRPVHPLQRPFAFALVKLDGADTAMLHAVKVAGPEDMKTGMRVEVSWAESRTGKIGDIACFVPEAS